MRGRTKGRTSAPLFVLILGVSLSGCGGGQGKKGAEQEELRELRKSARASPGQRPDWRGRYPYKLLLGNPLRAVAEGPCHHYGRLLLVRSL